MVSMLLLWTFQLYESQPDAKSLLHDATAHYRNAQSFRIRVTGGDSDLLAETSHNKNLLKLRTDDSERSLVHQS
jgi:hypothetical protein